MPRAYNFSAGPAALPEPVLLRAREELLDWHGTGASIVELSHRGPEFMEVAAQAEADLRELLSIPDSHAVIFTAGGATTQQALMALNFAAPGQAVDFVVSGHWSKVAMKQAAPYVDARIAASSEGEGFHDLPPREEWRLSPDAAYVHVTANETIHGVEWPAIPEAGNAPLFADFSSSIASAPLDLSRFALVYAGAQKNLGPVGVGVVIVRRDLLERAGQPRADIFNYASHAARDSMLNTPPTWNWYLLGLNVRWMLDEGGVAEFARRSGEKSRAVYAAIDGSGGFYRNEVAAGARSRMNVPFFLPDAELDARFVAESRAAGMIGLKGHKAVGGIRASLYNAVTADAVAALVAFMRDFASRHG
jgi:phosphoserine aminotransferase